MLLPVQFIISYYPQVLVIWNSLDRTVPNNDRVKRCTVSQEKSTRFTTEPGFLRSENSQKGYPQLQDKKFLSVEPVNRGVKNKVLQRAKKLKKNIMYSIETRIYDQTWQTGTGRKKKNLGKWSESKGPTRRKELTSENCATCANHGNTATVTGTKVKRERTPFKKISRKGTEITYL